MARCRTTRDGFRCDGDADREHDCETVAPEYAEGMRVSVALPAPPLPAALSGDTGASAGRGR